MEDIQEEKKMFLHATHVAHFEPATLRVTKSSTYIEYKYENTNGMLVRKRTNINHLLKKLPTRKEQKAYSAQMVCMINERLSMGWTPEQEAIKSAHPKGVTPWRDVFVQYRRYLIELEEYGDLRHAGAQTYASDLNLLEDWITQAKVLDKKERHKKIVRDTEKLANGETVTPNKSADRIKYIYELNADAFREYLEWARVERELGPTTLKNYRRWLSTFCTWLKDKGFFKENPMTNVKVPAVGSKKKDAIEYITKENQQRIFDYWAVTDRHMLLACYLCYYLFIRPKEIMQLRVGNFHLAKSMVFIPKEISKTDRDAWVTLPDKVAMLLVELGTLNHPQNWLIFDKHLLPAPAHTHINNGEALRERWADMRTVLHLPKRIWFYHLKHSGITDLVRELTPRQVQLQARHSSLSMTERYMRPTPPEANEDIKNLSWIKK